MTTIQLLSDTHALLIDQDIKTDIYFDVPTKNNISLNKAGKPSIILPANSTGRKYVSLKAIENGEPYELRERDVASTAPRNLDGTSDADRKPGRKTSLTLQQYVNDLANHLDDTDKTLFLDLLTKAITRKSAQDTLAELKALYAKKQEEANATAAKIAELEAQL